MARCHPILELQAFIEERYAAARRNCPQWPSNPPCVPPRLTAREAEWFLRTVHDRKSPLFTVTDENRHLSDRYPPNAGDAPKNYTFFHSGGRLSPETIVHQAAMWRLHKEFGWPLSRLIFQSPDIPHAAGRFGREALDILLLKRPATLRSEMRLTEVRRGVGVEVKDTSRALDRLLEGMRVCQGEAAKGHDKSDHRKCQAIDLIYPKLFLALAAGEDWRLFPVVKRDGRAVLGKQLRNLDRLYFT